MPAGIQALAGRSVEVGAVEEDGDGKGRESPSRANVCKHSAETFDCVGREGDAEEGQVASGRRQSSGSGSRGGGVVDEGSGAIDHVRGRAVGEGGRHVVLGHPAHGQVGHVARQPGHEEQQVRRRRHQGRVGRHVVGLRGRTVSVSHECDSDATCVVCVVWTCELPSQLCSFQLLSFVTLTVPLHPSTCAPRAEACRAAYRKAAAPPAAADRRQRHRCASPSHRILHIHRLTICISHLCSIDSCKPVPNTHSYSPTTRPLTTVCITPPNMTVVGNVLSADSLASVMASTLPQDTSPHINTPFDAIALASHASMLACGFRLVGLGDDDRITVDNPPRLPATWSANAPNYAFRYAHTQSSMEYLLKINRMGNKAVVLAMGLGDDKTATLDVKAADYTSAGSMPFTLSEPNTRNLFNLFISNGRLSDYGSLMRLNIIQKLVPSLQKEGYQESAATSARQPAREPSTTRDDPLRDDRQPPARPHPFNDPLAQPAPHVPHGELAPPGFEDPYDLNRPLRPMGGPPHPGFGNIGERDLYPQGLGPRDPFGNPGFGGGGMHPTLPGFDDPRGRGYNPQAPPGSRFDPVGPRDPSGFGGPPNPFNNFGSGDFM